MTSALARSEKGTITLTITIPWKEVSSLYQDVAKKAIEQVEVPGFRKGKAPPKIAEEKIDKTKVYEEVLRQLLPKVYGEAVEAQKIRPIVTPKIELREASEGKDWVIMAQVCERPTVSLGDYRKAMVDLSAAKKQKIWVPGEKPKTEGESANKKPTIDELLNALSKVVTVNLPALLVEREVNRLLSELIDQTKKLGLTVDQYLVSTGRSADTIRHEYEEQAKRTLTLEFALEEIADREGILVSDDDIDAVVKTAKTNEERKALEKERYYLASILRRQKTLDFLSAM